MNGIQHQLHYSVTSNHVSAALKLAAGTLEYPTIKCIPIEWVNTHSLRSGGANALALAGYSDTTQIQKMGRWRGAMFKEYVRNELACFSSGMSRDMKQKFGFVNVSGNAFSDITDACVNAEYSAPSALTSRGDVGPLSRIWSPRPSSTYCPA